MTNRRKIETFIMDNFPDESARILLADGFDEAFLGVGRVFGGRNVAIYDRTACVKILQQQMTVEEAEEYFSFNTEGAYVGEYTPIYMVRVGEDDDRHMG